jgi:hypothetical protein
MLTTENNKIESCVGRGLCVGLITRLEESYRVSNCKCDHRNREGALCSSWERQEKEWMEWIGQPDGDLTEQLAQGRTITSYRLAVIRYGGERGAYCVILESSKARTFLCGVWGELKHPQWRFPWTSLPTVVSLGNIHMNKLPLQECRVYVREMRRISYTELSGYSEFHSVVACWTDAEMIMKSTYLWVRIILLLHTAAIFFNNVINMRFTAHCSKIYHRTSIYHMILSGARVAPTSEIRAFIRRYYRQQKIKYGFGVV